mmetsp:Transcript_15376/g.30024  ORF Transcript_15376/g.30024 Transcript_15376/m.30024 type:complete len:213 (-) Transcript_15376:233-871(-)
MWSLGSVMGLSLQTSEERYAEDEYIDSGPCAIFNPDFCSWVPISFGMCGVTGRDCSPSFFEEDEISYSEVPPKSTPPENTVPENELEISKRITQRGNPRAPPRIDFQSQLDRKGTKPGYLRKRLTMEEAYKEGLMVEYITQLAIDDIYFSKDDRGEYEKNWKGHQPLVPNPWSDPYGEGGTDRRSASEQRFFRQRRRRGVLTRFNRNKNLMG